MSFLALAAPLFLMATAGCGICWAHPSLDPSNKSPWECAYLHTVYFLQHCVATGFGVSLILGTPFHTLHIAVSEKDIFHIFCLCILVADYTQVCFQNIARDNLHNLEADTWAHYAKVSIYMKIGLPFLQASSCKALPCWTIHRAWEGRARAGNTHTRAIAKELADLQAAQGNLLVGGGKGNPRSLTPRIPLERWVMP